MKRHGPTRQSSTESHTAEWRTEICVAFSRLTEIGEQAVAAVAASLARGGPVIKGQLIASRFYEAMQHELKRLHTHDPKRAALIAASERCERYPLFVIIMFGLASYQLMTKPVWLPPKPIPQQDAT